MHARIVCSIENTLAAAEEEEKLGKDGLGVWH